jgi:hypothetical protein
MILNFQPPVYAEMLRDGGSLVLGFFADGCSFWLLFPVKHDKMGGRSGYGAPVVVNRSFNIEEAISWEVALIWLKVGMNKLQKEDDKKWVEAMIKTCSHSGCLPRGVAR